MPKDLKEKIKSFLSGIITTNNKINDGLLNQEGIDYICEKATNHILELFEEEKQKWVGEILKEIENMELTEYQGTKISAYLKRSLKR